jgi:hypothetical protein
MLVVKDRERYTRRYKVVGRIGCASFYFRVLATVDHTAT